MTNIKTILILSTRTHKFTSNMYWWTCIYYLWSTCYHKDNNYCWHSASFCETVL